MRASDIITPTALLRVCLILAALAVMAAIALLLAWGNGAQAQDGWRAIPNLDISSPEPGQLVITWNAPSERPDDYRVSWAPADLDYLSWQDENETLRGNSYPDAHATSLSLTGLPEGREYKVMVRSRYQGGSNPGSGPWREARGTVSSTPQPTAEPTPEATPEPTPEATGNPVRVLYEGVMTVESGDLSSGPVLGYSIRGGGLGSFVITEAEQQDLVGGHSTLLGLMRMPGEHELPHGTFTDAVAVMYAGSERDFVVTAGGQEFASRAAVGGTYFQTASARLWLWENRCANWLPGDRVEVSVEAVSSADSRLLGASSDASLGALTLQGATLDAGFDPAATAHSATSETGVDLVTVAAEPADPSACAVGVSPEDADPDAAGHQIDLGADGAAVTVTVVAEDNVTVGIHSLSIARRDAAAASRLGLQGVPDLGFDPSQRRYDAPMPPGRIRTSIDVSTPPGAATEVFSLLPGQDPVRSAVETRRSGDNTVTLSPGRETLVVVRITTDGNRRQSIYTVRLTPPQSPGSGTAPVAQSRVARQAGPRLASLTVAPGTLTPAFSASTYAYDVAVGHAVGEVTVAGTAAGGASVSVAAPDADSDTAGHQVALNAGSNGESAQTAFLVVVSTDTQIESYAVTVTRAAPPPDTTLSALEISAGALTPAFDPATTAYTAQIAAADSPITVAANAASADAMVDISPDDDANTAGHQVSLDEGDNTITVTVTNGGATGVYSIVATRSAASTDASLAQLSLSEGTFAPALAPAVFSYSATVKPTTERITLSAAATDPGAVVVVSPPDTDTVAPGHQVDVAAPAAGASDPAQTVVYISVTATDGATRNTYTLTVNRPPPAAGARLGALTVSPGAMTPAFDAQIFEYQVTVASDTGHVTVSATPATGAVARIIAIDAQPDADGHQVALNPAPDPGAEPTMTSFLVLVTDDANVDSYAVTVNRQAPPSDNADLAALGVGSGDLEPAFDPSHTGYEVHVETTVSRVTIVAPAARANSAVAVTPGDADPYTDGHQIELREGPNSVTVAVTAPDGVTTKTYTVSVIREFSSADATLSSLSFSEPVFGTVPPIHDVWGRNVLSEVSQNKVALTPEFSPATNGYAVQVDGATREVTIAATAAIDRARVVISPPDANLDKSGHQVLVDLPPPGATEPAVTTVVVAVTSTDETTRNTYTIKVNRPLSVIGPLNFDLPRLCYYHDIGPVDWSEPVLMEHGWATTEHCHGTQRLGSTLTLRSGQYFRLFVRDFGQVTLRVRPPDVRWRYNVMALYSADGTQVALDFTYNNPEYNAWLTTVLPRGVYAVEVHKVDPYIEFEFELGVWDEGNVIRDIADYRLDGLTIDGASVSGFDAETFEYQVNAPGAASVTVAATTDKGDAILQYSMPDADANTAGHQVALVSDGATELTVSVAHPELPGFPYEYKVTINP